MNERNRRIIEAVKRKADLCCALRLIGVYGSAATGDEHEKSDLDLLLLFDGEGGEALTDCFILDDTGVGYDLYATTWESLEEDASCPHARLAKLMDAELVEVRSPEAAQRLAKLREKAASVLRSDAGLSQARKALERAKAAYADAVFADSFGEVRFYAGLAVTELLDAVMLAKGRYFRRGVKRTFEEIGELGLPFDMEAAVLRVIRAKEPDGVRDALHALITAAIPCVPSPETHEEPKPENLVGTYEEMVSNWRNKMTEADARGDVFSSFMNLASLEAMTREIPQTAGLRFLDRFDPDDLAANTAVFDEILSVVLGEYEKAGVKPRHFADEEAFEAAYLNS